VQRAMPAVIWLPELNRAEPVLKMIVWDGSIVGLAHVGENPKRRFGSVASRPL
jgi:hypothetical protein